jgi:hypothetical protein
MNEIYDLHKEVFGVAPIVIGLHWQDATERILAAIDADKPYNEENELTPEDLASYRNGELVF